MSAKSPEFRALANAFANRTRVSAAFFGLVAVLVGALGVLVDQVGEADAVAHDLATSRRGGRCPARDQLNSCVLAELAQIYQIVDNRPLEVLWSTIDQTI